MDLQTVAHIIQSDATRNLCIEHGDDMTPGREATRLLFCTSFTREFFDQMARNEIANLAESGDLAAGWFSFFVFHPC